MGFIRIRDKHSKEDSIINTDMIMRISKTKNGCMVFFPNSNAGPAYYEYDEINAQKIFDEIDVSL